MTTSTTATTSTTVVPIQALIAELPTLGSGGELLAQPLDFSIELRNLDD